MEKNLILKTLGLVAIGVGIASVATTVWAKYKKRKAEEDTAKAIVDAEVIAQNFSGVDNRRNPKHNNRIEKYNNLTEKHNNRYGNRYGFTTAARPVTPRTFGGGSRRMFNGNGYEQINDGGLSGGNQKWVNVPCSEAALAAGMVKGSCYEQATS